MQKDTVLILTQGHDGHADQACEEFERRGHAFIRFDTALFPQQAILSASYKSGNAWQGGIHFQDQYLDVERIKSIWYRKPTHFQIDPQMPPKERYFARNEARSGIGGILRAVDCLWVNHPEKHISAEYKPFQLHIARTCELQIPPTLITNDPQAVKAFFHRYHGGIIYKALSMTTIQREEFANIYTTLIADEKVLEAMLPVVPGTANLYQQHLPKQADIRVTIIGKQVFATEIDSQASELTSVDFRRSYDDLGAYRPHILPVEIQEKLLILMQRLDLMFGAIDMILTLKKQYIFLEVNPAGQFNWLEAETGVPMMNTLVDLLIAGKEEF